MANERVDSEIVTQFLLNTCRLCPQLTGHAVEAALCCACLATRHLRDDVEEDHIPLTTGSVAEFYIEPMLPLVGDIDVMFYQNNSLAIPRGHPPPTQLPAEFHNYVKVVEIIDSHLSGYVYLELRYLLTYCPEDEKYNYVKYDEKKYMCVDKHDGTGHGPARLSVFDNRSQLSVDVVNCVRCLLWPPQAADWPKRHRNYDWPDSATVDRVINNGYDVVYVSHRQCRQHEWMSKRQWRLSFSRAEIVLLNSWTPVQQIVYHMLRAFMKTERLTDSDDNTGTKILSNYHLKTLMLWACELKPRSWWTDDLNFVRISVQLLHTLALWLTDARCQHYFIDNCNLFDHFDNSVMTASILTSETEASLAEWFIGEYICKTAAELCPKLQLFEDMSSRTSLQNAVSQFVYWRLEWLTDTKEEDFYTVQYIITFLVYLFPLSKRLLQSWIFMMRRLANIDQHAYLYFAANTFLHVAYKTTIDPLSDELLDVLFIACLQSSERRRCLNARHSSVLSLSQAAKLMKVVANNSRNTVQLIEIELSKAYLHRALRCKDSDSDSIYCLANVYLAVLYYTTGQYQTAIDHCTLVMRSQDHSQCSSHVVQGELLPKIDDDIDTALGLAVLYQFVLSAALNQRQQRQYSSVFTTKLFVCYLHIKFLSVIKYYRVAQLSLLDVYQRYEQCISGTQQLFISDTLIVKSLSCALEQGPIRKKLEVRKYDRIVISERKIKTSELVELLQQSAVEHLTTYRQLKAQVFTSVVEMAATDYEALYTYKRGDYQRCLLLSTQNARTRQHTDYKPSIFTLPCFILLMDDDIVSLIALVLIVNPECRDAVKKTCINQVTLSLYLMAQCQLKLHHSVTSLARTLECISVALRKTKYDAAFDQLTLKLASRKLISSSQQKQTIG